MFARHLFSTTAAVALCALPFAASASPIRSDVSITITTGFSGQDTTTSVTDSFAEPGDVTVTEGFFENLATQNADGTSEANAESRFGGDADFELVTSTASLTQGETNNSGATRQYFLDYTLQGLQASFTHVTDQILFDGETPTVPTDPPFMPGDPLPPAPTDPLPAVGTTLDAVNPFSGDATDIIASSVTGASFEYFINVNGQNVFSTRADAMVTSDGALDIAGTGIFANTDTTTLVGDAARGYEFNIAPIMGRFTFDDLTLDGDDVIVTSGLIARAYSHDGFETEFFGDGDCNVDVVFDSDSDDFPCDRRTGNGVNSFFFDPVTISSLGFTVVDVNPGAVPLPAAGWMLIAGLGGLAAMGRRRKS